MNNKKTEWSSPQEFRILQQWTPDESCIYEKLKLFETNIAFYYG